MDTDSAFIKFIEEHLDEHLYDKLIKRYDGNYKISFLASMSTSPDCLPENISILVEEFLATLPFEIASAYVSTGDPNGSSLIFYCANIAFIKSVIRYVPDVGAYNIYGNTALMYACECGRPNLDIIEFFLDCGANVNAVSKAGRTALMWACDYCTSENIESVTELLIFSGADPLIKSNNGYIAYDYVQNKSLLSERTAQLLQGCIKMNNTKRAA